jgi:hypothetical protein
MLQRTNNSKNLNRTCPPHRQPIECYHPKLSQSLAKPFGTKIDPSEVGRVRLRSIEFNDDYLHQPAPTDPIFDGRSGHIDRLNW